MQVVNNTAHLTKPKTDSCTDNTLLLTRKVQTHKKGAEKIQVINILPLQTDHTFPLLLKIKIKANSHLAIRLSQLLKIEGRNMRFLNSDLTFPPNSDLTFPLSQFLENWKWECQIRICILLSCASGNWFMDMAPVSVSNDPQSSFNSSRHS